ncbi:MAG: hypothetical protein KKF20_03405 [Bacteroidetes bacterium]|nr:hypothetical protein [Bacteroidota bacterium]
MRQYEAKTESFSKDSALARHLYGGSWCGVLYAVARSIVNNPPIVLADEPTANLDSATAHTLIDLMEKMCAEKKITFVFSSHDRQVLERAKRVLILKDGKIEQ